MQVVVSPERHCASTKAKPLANSPGDLESEETFPHGSEAVATARDKEQRREKHDDFDAVRLRQEVELPRPKEETSALLFPAPGAAQSGFQVRLSVGGGVLGSVEGVLNNFRAWR